MMRINKVVLHNIRSYTHEEVSFPEGSVLLSGDIGSGKSSLLLAMEFAIFGILRGQLEGSALLRHGAREGHVTLHASINDQSVQVTRKLKRTNRGITQDAGSIIIDGIEQQATASEIKSKMLDLMGYPADLLTKSKSLIFRYTVYTPQEQMKAILFEDASERLNTLRRVFDIDRYKRIKENAQVYTRTIRERRTRLEGELDGYDKKVQQHDALKSQARDAKAQIEKLEPEVKRVRGDLSERQSDMLKIEGKVKQLFEYKKQLQVLETTIKYEMQRKMDLDEQLKREQMQLQTLQEEFKDKKLPDHNTLTQSIRDSQKRLAQLQKEREFASRQISEFGIHIKNATDIKSNLNKLSACPVCLQDVGAEHKHRVIDTQNQKIKEHIKQQSLLQSKTQELAQKIKALEEDLEHLRQREKEAAIFTLKQTALKEKQQRVKDLEQKLPIITEKIKEAKAKQSEINQQVYKIENVEHEHKAIKGVVEDLQKQEQMLAVKLTAAQKDAENVDKLLKALAQEIAQKQAAKKKLEQLKTLNHWLSEFFIKLMDVIEKHVLLSVYHQFNGLFQKWFTTLIEDESMQARLDDAFTPIIIQNGYETELEHLSGGEKTSCALAYRLSLNRVINDLISTIHTKDLIILDEPTDGFSMEQLDRVRAVLDELDIKQVILVSHEAKIESFVDSIINVHKEDQVSKVIR